MKRVACAILAWGIAGAVAAQAISDPNQVAGTIGYTNRNAAVLRVLEDRPLTSGRVDATSRSPAPMYRHGSNIVVTGALGARYEVTVESDEPGIAYGIHVSAYRTNDRYTFAIADSTPVEPEPAPDARVDIAECAGILHLRFRDVLGRARPVGGGYIESTSLFGFSSFIHAGDTEAFFIVRGSPDPLRVKVRIQLGSDAYHDSLIQEATLEVVVPCDQIVELDFQCQGGEGPGIVLPRIVGNLDLIGVDEIPLTIPQVIPGSYTMVRALHGPWGNLRYDAVQGTPASGPFELENLMPSDVESPPKAYELSAMARHGVGRSAGWFRWPTSEEVVLAGEVRDLGDRLVTDPTRVATSVSLDMSPTRPGFEPILPSLVGSGAGSVEIESSGSWSRLHGGQFGARDGWSLSGLDGEVGAEATSYLGSAELLLGGLNGETTAWMRPVLEIEIQTEAEDGPSRVSEEISVHAAEEMLEAVPGARLARSIDACMSEVNLGFRSTTGTFYEPSVTTRNASFDGIDRRGEPVRYGVNATADGSPRLRANAAATGNVRMALPAADYVLVPWVTAVNPGGGVSTTQLPDVSLSVGCRQLIDLTPTLHVVVAETPACTDDGIARVTGSVRGARPVARIEHSVNGGPWTIACTDCGVDPAFAFDVALPAEDAAIAVRSTDADGDVATTTAHSRHAREPSAVDRRPTVQPLRVERSRSSLRLSWEPLPAPANVYAGTIDSLRRSRAYDHAPMGACDVHVAELELPMPREATYFLVGGSCAWGEGTLGRDSFGRERPPAVERCP